MVDSVSSVLTPEEMIANAQSAVASGKTTANMSAVEKLLAGRESATDTVDLSPVAKLIQARAAAAEETSTPYTEQDWYVKAKVSSLRAQIALYTNLPGLDPSGAIMESLQAEVVDLATKQADAIAALQAESDEKEAALAEKKRLAALEPKSTEELIQRAQNDLNGISNETISDEAQALLDSLKVDTTA